jgi:glycosyltransferase involved in cell wall biosynthesis
MSNRSPKRLLSISNHGYMVGGGEYSFLELMKNLPSVWQPIAVVPEEGALRELLMKASIKAFISPLSAIRPWTLHKVLRSMSNLIALIKRTKPDLIYANGPRASFYSCVTKSFHGLPVIWHCRVADRDPLLDWMLARWTNLIVANSHATANRFRKDFQPKITVVHNGIEITRFKEASVQKPMSIEENWKIILVSGRVSRQKRHDMALDIFEKVAVSQTDAHIVFVGDKDPMDHEWWEFMRNKSLNSHYSTRIHWVGHSEDIRPWYKSASVLLFPSENEGFGRVIVEAMACGLPIVATNSGAVPEIVRHNEDGILASPGDTDELADAVREILTNNSLRKRFGESAITRSDSFSLNTHVEKMTHLFDKTIRL